MAYTVEFNHPHFDKGEEFEVSGLGLIPNGGKITLDADQERDFIARNGVTLKDSLKDNEMLKLSGNSELKADEVKSLLPPEPVTADIEPARDEQGPGNTVGREATPGGGE